MSKGIEIKELPDGTTQFTANGQEYFVESKLSLDRYRDFQKMELHISFQQGFNGMFNTLKEIYEKAQKGLLADVAVLAHNAMQGVIDIEKRRDACFYMCALFINTKDEDRRTITNEQVDAKIKDWTEEGLDTRFFLQCAASLVNGFIPIYEQIFQSTLEAKIQEAEFNTLSKMRGA